MCGIDNFPVCQVIVHVGIIIRFKFELEIFPYLLLEDYNLRYYQRKSENMQALGYFWRY